MKFVKLSFVLLLCICSIAFAGKPDSQATIPSKSIFPDMEGRTKDLIAKIYALFIPFELKKQDNPVTLYPGKLYDVGGYRLHMFCMGVSKPGIPSILLETGVGGSSAGWLPIQHELSKRTQVCAYDRAGYGWSDEWSALKNIQSLQKVLPRSIDQNVEALEQLLKQAKISGQMILLGHSYGGPISLAFEAKYPDQVSGLVLLDPHDDGIVREDSEYTDEISDHLKHFEKSKSPESKVKWESQLKEIAGHLTAYQDGKVQAQILAEDLETLVNSLDPMKWYRVLWSEWKALHSSCAKVRTNPSKTLSHKALYRNFFRSDSSTKRRAILFSHEDSKTVESG